MEKEIKNQLRDFEKYVDKARHILTILEREKRETMLETIANKYNNKLLDLLIECYQEIQNCYKEGENN